MVLASSSKFQMLTAVVLRLSGHPREHAPLLYLTTQLFEEGNTP